MVKNNFLLEKVLLYTDILCLVALTINFGKFELKFSLNQLKNEFGMQLWMDHSFLNMLWIIS